MCPQAIGGRRKIEFTWPARAIGGRANIELALSVLGAPCMSGRCEYGLHRAVQNNPHAGRWHAVLTRCARLAAQRTNEGTVQDARRRSPRGLGTCSCLIHGMGDVRECVVEVCIREAIGGHPNIEFECGGTLCSVRDGNE